MTKLTLTNYVQGNTTVLENEFIDRYMVKANGEYVKVYLLLLRHMNRPKGVLSVSEMADILECTENDIRRALKYWKKQELLDYHEHSEADDTAASSQSVIPVPGGADPAKSLVSDNVGSMPSGSTASGHTGSVVSGHTGSVASGSIDPIPSGSIDPIASGSLASGHTGSVVSGRTDSMPPGGLISDRIDSLPSGSTARPLPAHVPEAPVCLPNIQEYRERKEFKELLFVAEQYLGKTLSSVDIDMITYFYDTLHMSAELIEYLIEYCVENGHKSMHYIRKVALSWNEQKLTTVSAAKASTVLYNKNCYSVLNAYGIKGRAPAASETAYIKRWNDEYGFSLEIILEACNRTINSIHEPSFEYTDTILKNWLEKNVRCRKDIDILDSNHLKEKERRRKTTAKSAIDNKSKSNKFNNFTGRSYDMDTLERKLVQQ